MNAPVAQLDRATVFETVGYRFESYWAHFPLKFAMVKAMGFNGFLHEMFYPVPL